MSVEAIAVVLNHSRATGSAKLVLIGIANHDGDGGSWPTRRTLARYAGVDPRNVKKAIERLKGLGEISVSLQAGGTADWDDHDRPNLYTIHLDCPPWCDRSRQHKDTRKPQAPLWKTPGTVAPPGDGSAPPPGTVAPPEGGTVAPPKPSTQPDPNHLELVSTDRARRDPLTEPCGICGQTRERCVARSAVHDMGHLFEPTWEKPKPAPVPPTLRSVRADQ